MIFVLMYKNKRKLRDLGEKIPHFEWQQQGKLLRMGPGLDFKEGMIKQNLKSGWLAVNSLLKRSREFDESQSTLGSHFLIWKNNFHLPHCENLFVTSELSEVLGRKV